MEIPYRCKGYSFGATDYTVYERQRQMLFSQHHLRALCLAGGIVWRLGRDLLREEEVLSGPTDTAVVFSKGVFYRDAQGNFWCDDTLTGYEMDLVCGLHTVATGTYSVVLLRCTLLIIVLATFRQPRPDGPDVILAPVQVLERWLSRPVSGLVGTQS
jgi:hypothetical protein